MRNTEKMKRERALPELMQFQNGEKVKTLSDFEERKKEIKTLLAEYEYGYIPNPPEDLKVETIKTDLSFCAGKAPLRELKFTVKINGEDFSFPVFAVVPEEKKKHPAFIHINFRPDVPDRYLPSEEVADRGYAVFSFCYKDVTSDDGDFNNGIASHFAKGEREQNAPGKIAMWAWAAMRVMDYVQTLNYIDLENIAVIGHSRLGKTALLTGAHDERFKYVISNNSGCSGAAITRGKIGENVPIITSAFPFWFCPRYVENAKDVEKLPFDQHHLTSLIAPRHLIISSAKEDTWADPESEFLSCVLANEAYAMYGMRGLVHNEYAPEDKTVLSEGDSCYHFRRGQHYLGREDWGVFMDFIDSKIKKDY